MITENSVLNTRYRLEKKIGQGGFAQVFLAMDQLLKRRVAVKVLNSELVADENFLGRFEREAQSIAALEHPNILSVYDYGQAEDTAYLVTPYVEGGTLHDKLRKEKKFTLEQASQYLTQVAAALDYAHRRFIVHRDIKPQNMLLRAEDDRLLLGDFGIAKVLSSASANSRTGVMGTISYMAPEQLEGNVGVGTDIYALGCVLFQMLTGELPFNGPTEQVMMGHLLRPVPSIIERSQGQLPQEVQDVINRALAKKPEDRFPSAGEMAKAFQRIATGTSSNTGASAATQVAGFSPPQVQGSPTAATQVQGTYNQFNQPQVGGTPPHGFVPPAGTPPQGYSPPQGYTPPVVQQGYNPQPPYGQPVPPVNTSYGYHPPVTNNYPPKKSNAGLIGGIIAVVTVAVVVIVILVIIGGNKKDPTATPVASITNTPASSTTAATLTTVAAPTSPAAPTTAANNNPTPTTGSKVPTPTVGSNTGAVPSGWKELNSTEGGFSIVMPPNPTNGSNPVSGIDVVYYQSNIGNDVSYTASYANYSANVVDATDADTFLQSVLEGQQSSLNATNTRDEKKLDLNGVPGRTATYDISQGSIKGVAISRAYLSNDRLYQLLVIYTTGKKPSDSAINTFFDSFKITG